MREWRSKAFEADAGDVLDDPLTYKDELLRPVANARGALVVEVWNTAELRWEKGEAGSLQNAMPGRRATSQELIRAEAGKDVPD